MPHGLIVALRLTDARWLIVALRLTDAPLADYYPTAQAGWCL
jgi:hypothetical protein